MKARKKFDSVRMMRRIRDNMSRQIQAMSFEEERRFIENQLRQEKQTSQRHQSMPARRMLKSRVTRKEWTVGHAHG